MEIDMESYDLVHSIKADAIVRYKLFTNITRMLQLMEVFVALAFILWSSIRLPFVFKLSSHYLLAFTSYLMNQHVVFLVGNAIVFLCYILSRYSDSENESVGFGIHHDDSKEYNLTHGKSVTHVPNPKPVLLQAIKTPLECKDVVIPDEKAMNETVREPVAAPVTAIKQAAKRIERFRRTQSDLRRKISVKARGELRRSMTDDAFDGEAMVKSVRAVDELSNEEFRIAVERFISQQQRILKQQSLVVDGS